MSLATVVDVLDEKRSPLAHGAHCSIATSQGLRHGTEKRLWHGVLQHPNLADEVAGSFSGRLWLVALNWERAVLVTGAPASSDMVSFDGQGEPPPGAAKA
ncbi:MAG: hypothetical protein WBF66_02610 [Dehalococcoidia bacterium]